MRTTLVMIVSALASAPSLAQAAGICTEREALVKELGAAYEEAPVAQALTSDGKMMEVLASKSGETWTLLITRPDGMTCALAEGQYWQLVEHELRPDGPQT